jgi:phosphoglucomutase
MKISPLAGKPATQEMLANIPKLVSAYYTDIPDHNIAAQKVAFGTSGHRGSSFTCSFNEWHILAITQSICMYRKINKIDGPLYIGIDTHALSVPAFASALEVLAANGVQVMTAGIEEYTPTPVISHAILAYNKGRKTGLADGIVITPSHNPPKYGGFKYNPPNGGAADTTVTNWIEAKANELLEHSLAAVKRIPFEKALRAPTTHKHDYLNTYIADLGNVIDMGLIRSGNIHIGVNPLGGAGVHYWAPIADRYKLNLNILNNEVDPDFRFMTLDWDGQIRMDPSSAYAMENVVAVKDKYDITFACDTDHDRHGIVTKSNGLLPPNHYLSVCISYLSKYRPGYTKEAAIGKTVVTTELISRIAAKMGRKLYDAPVGFKWFAEGLLDGSLFFAGEESAGASFARLDGSVWTTDKDGFIPALLSAEITSRTGKDPGEIYNDLTKEYGEPVYDRAEAPATGEQKKRISALSPKDIKISELAGEKITDIQTVAPGNQASIGGIKVSIKDGWFAARPSGTEDIYKIYAESFAGNDHLKKILNQAQEIIDKIMATS